MIKNFPIIIVCIFIFLSCKKNTNAQDFSAKKELRNDTLKVNYYSNKKIKDVLLSEYKGEKNVKLFFSQNGVLTSKTTNFNEYPQINSEYNGNGKVIHQWTEGDIGGCIGVKGKEFFWDNQGILIKEIIHESTNASCSEKIIIRKEKEYYNNSKTIKTIKNFHESYEGSEDCPCGEWLNYNKNGNLIGKKIYTSCEELPICNMDVSASTEAVSEKWIGSYKLIIQGKGSREGNQYNVNLNINKDNVIFELDGYQVYQNFILSATENNNEIQLTYKESIDDTKSWALEKTKNFGVITHSNDKYIWSSPYLDISFTDGKKINMCLKNNLYS